MRIRRHQTEPSERHDALQGRAHHRVLLDHADVAADGTSLCLRDGRTLRFTTLPNRDGAPRVRSVLRRISHVEIVVGDGLASAAVRGLGHRRQHAVPVSIGTALALALEGSPTVVDLVDDPFTDLEVVPA